MSYSQWNKDVLVGWLRLGINSTNLKTCSSYFMKIRLETLKRHFTVGEHATTLAIDHSRFPEASDREIVSNVCAFFVVSHPMSIVKNHIIIIIIIMTFF